MSTAINETLIRDVVEEVLGRLGGGRAAAPPPVATSSPVSPSPPRGTPAAKTTVGSNRSGRRFGVFADADEACEAAHEAYLQLSERGVAGRTKVVEIVKELCFKNATEWGRIELEETKIGRLDHKVVKLEMLEAVPGVEFLQTAAHSGDQGISLDELAPWGVIGVITPVTHSIPTLTSNAISMIAAGNAMVVNPHPGGAQCAAMAND